MNKDLDMAYFIAIMNDINIKLQHTLISVHSYPGIILKNM